MIIGCRWLEAGGYGKPWDPEDIGQLVGELLDVVFRDDDDNVAVLVRPVTFLADYKFAAGVEINCFAALLLKDDTIVVVPRELLSVLANVFPNVFANVCAVVSVGNGVGNGVALAACR